MSNPGSENAEHSDGSRLKDKIFLSALSLFAEYAGRVAGSAIDAAIALAVTVAVFSLLAFAAALALAVAG